MTDEQPLAGEFKHTVRIRRNWGREPVEERTANRFHAAAEPGRVLAYLQTYTPPDAVDLDGSRNALDARALAGGRPIASPTRSSPRRGRR